MKKRGIRYSKRSQSVFGMPFTVIFSIIIIVAILATAFYVIRWWLEFQRCSEAGLFFKDLEKEVRDAYTSTFTDTGDKPFTRPLPGSVEKVCIADLENDIGSNEQEKEMLTEFKRYADSDSNVFLYPSKKICYEASSKFIEYLEEKEDIYCFEVRNGKVEIRIKRDYEGKVQLLRQ